MIAGIMAAFRSFVSFPVVFAVKRHVSKSKMIKCTGGCGIAIGDRLKFAAIAIR